MGFDFEFMKSVLDKNKRYFGVAKVQETELSQDKSVLFAKCLLLPENFSVIAKVTWESVGGGGGLFQIPQKDDLVLLVYPQGEETEALIVKRFSSIDDFIPDQAHDGDTVLKAIPEKDLHLIGTNAFISKGGASDPTEAIVLGNILKSFATDLLDQLIAAIDGIITGPVGIGNLSAPVPIHPTLQTALEDVKTELESQKSEYVTTSGTNFLSQFAFTER